MYIFTSFCINNGEKIYNTNVKRINKKKISKTYRLKIHKRKMF